VISFPKYDYGEGDSDVRTLLSGSDPMTNFSQNSPVCTVIGIKSGVAIVKKKTLRLLPNIKIKFKGIYIAAAPKHISRLL